eukprot:SAG22_NODE_1709_length_3761_cov_9.920535_2_plen_56_part_00
MEPNLKDSCMAVCPTVGLKFRTLMQQYLFCQEICLAGYWPNSPSLYCARCVIGVQ